MSKLSLKFVVALAANVAMLIDLPIADRDTRALEVKVELPRDCGGRRTSAGPSSRREQVADLEEGPLQSVHGRVQEVQDLPLQGAPARLALLPGVQLQEGHLRHVRQEDDERQELQAEQPVVTNAV